MTYLSYHRMNQATIELLEQKYQQFNRPYFITTDPISIPHSFSKKQDIEIAGFFVAILAWGQRKSIIKKSLELCELMDNAPHDFILNHRDSDIKRFLNFRHRTFNDTDTLYFIAFFRWYYSQNSSLETAFSQWLSPHDTTIEKALIGFHNLFFSLPDVPDRTRKHVATPTRGSLCKRLCMYLRWLVRSDNAGVDFGLWQAIKPSQLVCPCDVHVERVARYLGLISRPQSDWKTALELTQNLRNIDPSDPTRFDFALFGLGIEGFC